MKKIHIYAKEGLWSFANVAGKFDLHVQKSVPFYKETHKIVQQYLSFFIKKNSTVYDLGCSTGLYTKQLAIKYQSKSPQIKAFDIETKMIHYAKKKNNHKCISYFAKDITKIRIHNADAVTSFYTIQFIEPAKRQEVISKIYKGINWGGAFIWIEKVRGTDARFQDMLTQLYDEFKIDQGFSNDEIMNKRKSLKGVLEPFSTAGNFGLLRRAGFRDIMIIFKYLNFEGYLAIK